MYSIEIKNLKQPMLITKAKRKNIHDKNLPKVCFKIFNGYITYEMILNLFYINLMSFVIN